MPSAIISNKQMKDLIKSYLKLAFPNLTDGQTVSFAKAGVPAWTEVTFHQTGGNLPIVPCTYSPVNGDSLYLKVNDINEAIALWLNKKLHGDWKVTAVKRILGGKGTTDPVAKQIQLVIIPIRKRSSVQWFIEPIGPANKSLADYLDKTTGLHEAQFNADGRDVSAYAMPDKQAVEKILAHRADFDLKFNVFRCGLDGRYRLVDPADLRKSLKVKVVKGSQLPLIG